MTCITSWIGRVWLAFCVFASAYSNEVIILKSGEGALYEPVVQAVVKELKRRTPDLNPPIFSLSGSKTDTELIKNLLARQPRVIVAIGTDSALLLKHHTEAMPPSQRPVIVFTLVLDPVVLGLVQDRENPDAYLAGVALTVRPLRQFRALLDVLPTVKKVGVIYNPDDTTSIRLIQQARDDAEKMGLQLVEAHASQPKQVSTALRSLEGQVEAFWLIPDPVCANPQAFQQIQAFTSEKKIPLLAFSESYVRRGALMAVGPDLGEQGILAGELVSQILSGASPANLPLMTPRKLLSYYNLAQARRLGITIPEMLLNLAEKVIKQ